MRLRHLLLICAIYQCAHGATTTERFEIFTAEYVNNEHEEISVTEREHEPIQETPHKSISELVNEQTEAIKKIISEHKPPPAEHNDYPIVTKQEANVDNQIQIKEEKEKESIEELKKKCQHLSRIFDNEQQQLSTTTDKPKSTVQSFGPPIRPDFIRLKPKFPVPSPQSAQLLKKPQMAGNYFIFTHNPEMYGTRTNKYSDKLETAASTIEEESVPAPETEKPQEETTTPEIIMTTTPLPAITTTTTQPAPKFKYVRLEPLVLQNTILSNGKAVPYWYRVLPTTQNFVQIPDIPENAGVQIVAQPQSYNHKIPLPKQYQLYVDPQSGNITPNIPHAVATAPAPTPATTTTSTTEKPVPLHTRPQFFINPQTGMIYQSALPHQFIYHKHTQLQPAPTIQKFEPITTTTTTTTTTEAPKVPVPNYTVEITQQEEKPIEKKYKHEFRFVIPMVVTGTQAEVSNYPYQLDPYAYYPKNQRPETMNVPVPYVPNYQMIRALAIPNKQNEAHNKIISK